MEANILYQKYPTEEDCLQLIESIWWEGKPVCPYCKSERSSKIKTTCRYHCNNCNYSYSVMVDTMFHGTHIELQKWFLALCFIQRTALMNKKLSSRKLARYIGVNKNTACYVIKRISKTMLTNNGREKLLKLAECLEI